MSDDLNVVRVVIDIYAPTEHPSILEEKIRPKIFEDCKWVPQTLFDAIWMYYLFKTNDEAKYYVQYLKDNFQNEKRLTFNVLPENEFGSVKFGSVKFGSVKFGSVKFGSVR